MPNFFYFDQFNQKQGPVDEQQLKELVAQGVIGPQTPMQTDSGHKGIAGQISGLFAAPPPPFAQPASATVANQFCTNCGSPVFGQATACMSCGAVPTGHRNFCRNCGAELSHVQIVCTSCGAVVNTVGTPQHGKIAPVGVSDNSVALIVCSVLMVLFCCLPVGVVGLVFSILERVSHSCGIFYFSISGVFIVVATFLGREDIAQFAEVFPQVFHRP